MYFFLPDFGFLKWRIERVEHLVHIDSSVGEKTMEKQRLLTTQWSLTLLARCLDRVEVIVQLPQLRGI